MEQPSLAEVLEHLVRYDGPRILRDPARLQITLQARIGRSHDDEISHFVKVLKTPSGQRLVSTGGLAGLSPGDWAQDIAPESDLTFDQASAVITVLLTFLTPRAESGALPPPVLLSTPPDAVTPALGNSRSFESIAVIQIAYAPNGEVWAEANASMALTLMGGSDRRWTIDLSSDSQKASAVQRVRRLVFDPSGRVLVAALSDRLAAYDVETGAEIWSFSPPNLFSFLVQGPSDVAFLSEGQLLVPFDEGSLNLWNLGGWSERRRRMSIAPRMVAMLSDKSGFVGSDGSQTWVWDLPGFGRRFRLTYERVYALAGLPRRPIVAVRTLDQLQIVDVGTRQTMATVDVSPGLPLIAASPSDEVFAVGGEFGAVLYDLKGNELATANTATGARLTALTFDTTGTTLALGGIDGEVTHVPVPSALPTRAT